MGGQVTIQKMCSDTRIDKASEEPDWNFLNTIHYEAIAKENWKLLGEYFTPPGLENASQKNRMSWLNKFNDVRQKYSHPQRDIVKEEEFIFLQNLYRWLQVKLYIE